ncbi:hypothetical protein CVT26_004934, partial [Gymnopilus dilepis]
SGPSASASSSNLTENADKANPDQDTSWTPPAPYPGLGEYPTLIGEIGTPFDMDGKRSYGWTDGGKHRGDYGPQERALDASLQGCDARDSIPKGVLVKGKKREVRVEEAQGAEEEEERDRQRRRQEGSLSWTVWTYVPDDHSHEWGDGWNLEDLSLWSRDDLDLEEDSESESDSDSGAEEAMDDDGDSVQLKDASHRETDTDREEGMGNDVDEDALNSRALLLLNSSAVNVDGGGGKGGKRASGKKSVGRVILKRQPSKKAPMSTGMQVSTSVMSSALSLDTLDADGHGHGAHPDTRQKRTSRSRRTSVSSGTSTLSSSSASLSSPLKLSSAKRTSSPSSPSPLRLAGYTPHQSPYTFLTSGA